jgi:hypothetical protein
MRFRRISGRASWLGYLDGVVMRVVERFDPEIEKDHLGVRIITLNDPPSSSQDRIALARAMRLCGLERGVQVVLQPRPVPLYAADARTLQSLLMAELSESRVSLHGSDIVVDYWESQQSTVHETAEEQGWKVITE